MILLGTQLVGQARGVHHRTLRLLLGILGSLEDAIDLGLHGVDLIIIIIITIIIIIIIIIIITCAV